MKRLAILLLLAPGLLFCTGCFSSTDKEDRAPMRESKLRRMQRVERERREGEARAAQMELIAAGGRTIYELVKDLIDFAKGDRPIDAAKSLIDPNFPDLRRRAIVKLTEKKWGRQDPYLKQYEQMAKSDPDPSVRAMAIRALNRGRDKRAIAVFLSALEERNESVRLEAAKALANVPDASAVGPLIRHMEHPEENVDVRIACADALRQYPTSEVAQALVRALRDRNFGISWQARKSLQLMTGHDFRYDTVAWLNYLSGTDKPFTG
jgi:hypothetical protein